MCTFHVFSDRKQHIAYYDARRHESNTRSTNSMDRHNKTESAVFIFCRVFLFLRDPFRPDYPEA